MAKPHVIKVRIKHRKHAYLIAYLVSKLPKWLQSRILDTAWFRRLLTTSEIVHEN